MDTQKQGRATTRLPCTLSSSPNVTVASLHTPSPPTRCTKMARPKAVRRKADSDATEPPAKKRHRYFNNGGGAGGAKPYEANLNQIFDKYTDNPADKDTIGVEGTMQYLGDLDVPLDDITSLAILELVQAPTMGEITRKGFVEGWTARQ